MNNDRLALASRTRRGGQGKRELFEKISRRGAENYSRKPHAKALRRGVVGLWFYRCSF